MCGGFEFTYLHVVWFFFVHIRLALTLITKNIDRIREYTREYKAL